MAGKFALIVGNSHYDDASLSRLKAPDVDVRELEHVLKAPEIGQFDEVTTLVDEGCASVRKAVARFFDQRQRDDLLLLYFSGHGVKDEQGHLYLALRDTETSLLAGTAIETAFIAGRMDRSYSKRQVLMLDCCHSGAFAHGAKAAHGVSVGTAEAFEGLGVGRVVMTATDSTQYAWEGDQVIGDAENSLFTHFLIDGLKTGAADRDGDGLITVDELYDYVRDRVIDATPRQTPNKWTYRQPGEIVLAQNPFRKRSALPPEIEEALASKLPSLRLEAVRNLEGLLSGHHAERARAAQAALKDLSADDSRRVANAAAEALRAHEERAAVEGPAGLSAAAVSGAAALPVESAAIHAEIERAVEAEAAWRDGAKTGGPTDSLGSDIFISYAREDRALASALAKMLSARGWRVWWDRKIKPGEAFDVMIERELCTCKVAVVLWSANSVNATWVRNEARRASRRGVLVPILIDHVETPLEFENLQAADLTSWQPPADHPELDALFERIGALSPIPAERLARQAELERARKRKEEERLEREAAERRAREAEEARRAEAERLERERAVATQRAEAERVERERAEAARRKREAVAAAEAAAAAEVARREAEAEAARRAEAERIELERVETARRAEAERIERQRVEAARRKAEAAAAAEAARREAEAEAARRGEADRLELETAEAAEPPVVRRPWYMSRPTQTVFATLVLAVIAGGVWSSLPDRVRQSRPDQQASAPPVTLPSPTPSPGNNTGTTQPSGSAPAQPAQPSPRPPVVAPDVAPAPTRPVETPASNAPPTAPPNTGTARGRGTPATGDDAPRRLQQRLRDAQAEVARAKQGAVAAGAGERSEETYRQALREERRATNLQRTGRDEAAAQAFQTAAERFKKAETEARLSAEDEEQERQKQANAQRGQTPTNPPPAQKPPPLNLEVEKDAVIQTLRRYERASSSVDVAGVRSVYPGVPGESLKQMTDARSFALTIKFTGEIKFYNFSETRISAVAPTTFVFEIVTRSGQRNREERAQSVTLEKQRGGWIIADVR